MKWQLRFVKNSLFGLLPFPEHLRKFKRKFIPYDSKIEELTLEQGIKQVQILNALGVFLRDKTVLEIGTGWKPIIPLVFYLAGCKEIILVDSQRLLDKRTFEEITKGLLAYKNKISEGINVSAEDIEKKLSFADGDFEAILHHFHSRYLAPCDVRESGLQQKSVDIIISRAVLEHIPPEVIETILLSCHRLLKDNGKTIHIIDNSDHWQHNDPSIPRLNYLKFNDDIFKIISSFNPLDYQNRMRHFEYIELFKKTGYAIDYEKSDVDQVALEELKNIKVCKRYKNIPFKELAILTSYIVASKDKSLIGKLGKGE